MVANSERLWGEGPSERGVTDDGGMRWRGAPFMIVIAVLLLIFAVYIHSARNTATIDDNSARIAALEARAGRSADAAGGGTEVQRLKERIGVLEQELQRLKKADRARRTPEVPQAGVLLSSPGKLAPQRLQPPPGNSSSEELLAPDQGSSDWAQTLPEGDLPRYERRISPDGKLILRKLQ